MKTKLSLSLAGLDLLAACQSKDKGHTANKEVRTEFFNKSGMDTTVNPGDNFFLYANGQWMKKTEIPKTLQYLKNAIGYIKSKLSGIVTNYTKISRNDIQVQQKIYIIDNNDNLRCISVSGVIDESTLPDEIRLNINKEYHHELDLINIAINKLKATGNAYV